MSRQVFVAFIFHFLLAAQSSLSMANDFPERKPAAETVVCPFCLSEDSLLPSDAGSPGLLSGAGRNPPLQLDGDPAHKGFFAACDTIKPF